MRIDKAYKGISEETVVLYDDGMCDGPTLRVGEQYLMYTHGDGTGYLPSRGCTRSRNVKYADEDLAFLNSLASAAPTGTISGQITMTGNLARTDDPLAGATIEILDEQEKATTTTTDSNGRYSFFGLEPGTYVVRATKPGFSRTESDEENTAKVEARGCAVLDLVLRKNWPGTIRGRVIRPDGTSAQAGLSLDLIRVEGKGRSQKSEFLVGATAKTDESGEYSFVGVAPGSYKIALNLYKVPTAEDPYPQQYWPHAATEAGASTIEISENLNWQRCDFQLPVALTSTPVQFVVLLPDSTPAGEVHANIGTQMDGMFQWAGSLETDASGKFTFSAVQGFQYTVMDIMTNDAVMSSKVHFSASDRTQPITIKLVPRGR
jgi:protocatechuate 3,4-dioxygenase beta subunit